MIDNLDYYQILRVAPDAPPESIKAAYRKLQREHHPDVNGGDPAAHDRSALINLAYQELRDGIRRANYDRVRSVCQGGAAGRPRTAPIRSRLLLLNLSFLRALNPRRWTICIVSTAAASCVLLAWTLNSGAAPTSASSPGPLEHEKAETPAGADVALSFGQPRSDGVKGRLSYHLDSSRLP